MRGFAGYNFKADKLTAVQISVFIDRLDGGRSPFPYFGNATEWPVKNRTYLFHSAQSPLHIFGVGKGQKTDGVVWGSNEKNVLEMLYWAGFIEFFPYRVLENAIYYIEDGEVYIHHQKGEIVRTPQGQGKIWSIDDVNDICIELDDDKSVLFEFGVNEVQRT